MNNMSVATIPYADDTYELDSEGYVPSSVTVLPQPGNYRIKVTSASRRKDKDGQEKLVDGKFPILTLNRVEITEPFEEGGTFQLFQDVKTKPYKPKGRSSAASEAADMLVAIDRDGLQGLSDFVEVAQELENRLKSHTAEFTGYLGYSGYDKAYVDANLNPNMSAEEKAKVYNKARLNTKDFRDPQTGFARQSTMGPSGNLVSAKLKITTFVPATENPTLGPTQMRK
jgi:hypothetical protein